MHTRTGLLILALASVTPAALLLIIRAAPDVHILDSTKPAVTSSMTATTTATTTAVPARPQRPVDLSFVADESPCELLPPDQLGGLSAIGRPNLGALPEFGAPRCSFSNSSAGWAVTSITSTGMTGWLAQPATAATASTVGTPERIYDPATAKNHDAIHGYPAKVIDAEGPAACAVFVDVADDAMLLTEYRIVNGAAARAGAACTGAQRVAELALRTIIG